MMRSQPTGDSDNCEGVSEIGGAHPASVKPGTAYYLAQRQFQLMKVLIKNGVIAHSCGGTISS